MRETTTRRTVLKAGGATVFALAGCLGTASPGDEPTGDDHDHDDHGHETDSPTHHDHTHHDHGEIEGPEPSAEVAMITTDAGTHFDPHVVWVEKGATVTWVNESGMHSTTAYGARDGDPRRIPDGVEAWDSELLTEAGATFEHTFDTVGVYDYYCAPHEGAGMIGTVIVGEPDPHDQPGLADPSGDMPGSASEKIESLNQRVDEALGHTHEEATDTAEDHDEGDGHDETGH